MSIINAIKKELSNNSFKKPLIVFAEGWNPIIQQAASTLKNEGIIEPLLIFRTTEEFNNSNNVSNVRNIILNQNDLSKYANFLYELRKEKGMTLDEANKLVMQPNYMCSLIVKLGEADGAICGIEYTTKDTLKPALQIIKTSKDSKIVSSILILEKNDETLFYSDVSLVIDPTAEELANITDNAVKFVEKDLELVNNKVAMLSYSTNGSGAGASVDKVKQGYEIYKSTLAHKYTKTDVFGEIQFDAAYVDSVRNKKASNLNWNSGANVYIFPQLDSGNISYKMMQRCGGYEVTGPIIIGLDKPVNDLSRGAGLYEVVSLSYITALQGLKKH